MEWRHSTRDCTIPRRSNPYHDIRSTLTDVSSLLMYAHDQQTARPHGIQDRRAPVLFCGNGLTLVLRPPKSKSNTWRDRVPQDGPAQIGAMPGLDISQGPDTTNFQLQRIRLNKMIDDLKAKDLEWRDLVYMPDDEKYFRETHLIRNMRDEYADKYEYARRYEDTTAAKSWRSYIRIKNAEEIAKSRITGDQNTYTMYWKSILTSENHEEKSIHSTGKEQKKESITIAGSLEIQHLSLQLDIPYSIVRDDNERKLSAYNLDFFSDGTIITHLRDKNNVPAARKLLVA